MTGRAYTPEMLAERWLCTAQNVRNLINSGALPAFRIGKRRFRVPASAVEEFERCPTTRSADSTGDSSSRGGSTESDAAIVLRLTPAAMRSAKPSMSSDASERPRRARR